MKNNSHPQINPTILNYKDDPLKKEAKKQARLDGCNMIYTNTWSYFKRLRRHSTISTFRLISENPLEIVNIGIYESLEQKEIEKDRHYNNELFFQS